MTTSARLLHIHHCTSEPFRFFGRSPELTLLDTAYDDGTVSVVALVGPGGQGKTAIVQHWLERFTSGERRADGVFLWSFYRGKDADLCLRELYAYAAFLGQPADTSASYCVDHLLPTLRRERWVLILDGAEVVQHETGPWFGRFVHPELGRLIEELASTPMPGVVVLTTRFPIPGLERRKHAHVVELGGLDPDSARGLLGSLGVHGSEVELDEAAHFCGFHAKGIELLGTFLARFHGGDVRCHRDLSETESVEGFSEEEHKVARVLAAHQTALPQEACDILALATAFRDPPTEVRLLEYLASQPVQTLLHETWGRAYAPLGERCAGWLERQVQELADLRLLERVGMPATERVIDAHPLVRRAFEHVLGTTGRRQSAGARAGFLRGRPDRRRPATLAEAREEIEMFHAYCDAGLWNEADSAFVALDNPKHRFLAPAFERDLLVRFFPGGDWRRLPLWPGFGRYRSLAISLELLGDFEDAVTVYRPADAPLRGDALIALGRLGPLLEQTQAAHPWQTLWQAYRCHALCLTGRTAEAVALARSLVPVDVYEWTHVFECLLRTGQLASLDLRSFLHRPAHGAEHRWAELARQRMRADYLRLTAPSPPEDLETSYRTLIEEYDRGGLPYERALTRLSYAQWLLAQGRMDEALNINAVTLDLARRHGMRIMEADALCLAGDNLRRQRQKEEAKRVNAEAKEVRHALGYDGPNRT